MITKEELLLFYNYLPGDIEKQRARYEQYVDIFCANRPGIDKIAEDIYLSIGEGFGFNGTKQDAIEIIKKIMLQKK